MKKIFLLASICFITSIGFSQSIELQLFASGFTNPVNASHAGDSRLFVVERQGVIKILNSDSSVNNTPFLNINSLVSNNGGEQGLLGLAFHPNYSSNGYFYVNYIDNFGDTVISRFTRSTPDTADPNSEFILMTISQPYSNHNAGDMHFGPNDDYLYIATGDGGSGGDPGNRAQNLNNLLGKILRIDVDNTTSNPNLNYSIPSDNPFLDNDQARNEIWSYGLRNPWKFSFDKLNGDLWIADVGQSNKEEINRTLSTSPGGENFGWRCYEGNSTFNTAGCGSGSNYTFPAAEYSYGGNPFKCSITGGYRYRGSLQQSLQGLYFFADYCSGEIGYVEETSTDIFQLNFDNVFSGQNFSTFAEDVNGELYIIDINSGNISKITESNLGVGNNNINDISFFPNPANHEINIEGLNANISTIRIIDMQGKSIKTFSDISNEAIKLSVVDIEQGVYLLEINSVNGQKTVRKLLID
jgi:hypothetical protein